MKKNMKKRTALEGLIYLSEGGALLKEKFAVEYIALTGNVDKTVASAWAKRMLDTVIEAVDYIENIDALPEFTDEGEIITHTPTGISGTIIRMNELITVEINEEIEDKQKLENKMARWYTYAREIPHRKWLEREAKRKEQLNPDLNNITPPGGEVS
ncbi:MAG TPA: hypothetical protein VK154_00425 [Chitinophagales bacterium]|nr:hypothetical protein [Chitinophagales bacterium]